MKKFWGFLLTICIVVSVWICVARIVKSCQFNWNCANYLKRAADSNTVEMARDQLNIALTYLEKENLTDGWVSIFFHRPQCDIKFWYTNLKTSRDELNQFLKEREGKEPTLTAMESTARSNQLIKLRETLLDASESGSSITCPPGISIYPHNKAYFWGLIISGLVGVVAIIGLFVTWDSY